MGVIKRTNESSTKSKYETGQTKLVIYSHWNIHEAEWCSIHKCLTEWLNHIKRHLWWKSLILSCLEWVQLETSFTIQSNDNSTSNIFPSNKVPKVRGARLYEKAEDVSINPSDLLKRKIYVKQRKKKKITWDVDSGDHSYDVIRKGNPVSRNFWCIA